MNEGQHLPPANRNGIVPSWTLRRYRDGDEHAIVDLLNASFGDWGSLEHWKWKYGRSPTASPVVWLAECDNKIVGHFGMIPVTMKLGNAYVTACFTQDAATHPDCQGRGVFSSIVNRASLDASERGFPITYGFADTTLEQTYVRYERVGHICSMIPMTKVFDWEPFLARYIRIKLPVRSALRAHRKTHRSTSPRGTLTIERVSRFDESIDAFWKGVCGNFKIIVKRDQSYLNWRYVDNPRTSYTIYAAVEGSEVLGYCVLTKKHWQNLRGWQNLTLGLIVDILGFCDHRDVVGHLINKAVRYFEEQDVHGITCMISEKHPYAPFLREAGFIMPPRNLTHTSLHASINLPGIPIDEKEVYSQALLLSQNSLLTDKRNWFMVNDLIDMT